jgi:hypothetical protein
MKGRALLPACAVAISVALSGSGCDDPSRIQSRRILRSTVPPGTEEPALPEFTRSDESAQLSWDFDTSMSVAAYGAWVKRQLREFQLVEPQVRDLHFATLIDGDADRLQFSLQDAAGRTQVHVELTTSPD